MWTQFLQERSRQGTGVSRLDVVPDVRRLSHPDFLIEMEVVAVIAQT